MLLIQRNTFQLTQKCEFKQDGASISITISFQNNHYKVYFYHDGFRASMIKIKMLNVRRFVIVVV